MTLIQPKYPIISPIRTSIKDDPEGFQKEINEKIELLRQGVNQTYLDITGGSGFTSGSGAPTSTPTTIGDGYIDTDTGSIYVAVGTTGAWNWAFIGQGNLTAWTSSNPAGLTSWYDASNGVVPSTNGSTLTGWNDLSSTANHLTTVTNTPIIYTNIQNGLPAVYFDGNSCIDGSDKANVAQPQTMFVVFKGTAWSTGTYQCIWNNAVGAYGGRIEKNTGTTAIAISGGTVLAGDLLSNDTTYLVTAVFSGASSSLEVNDGAYTNGNAGTGANLNNPIVGANTTINSLFTGYVMEILSYDANLSEADRTIVRNYLNSKWGIF